MTKAVKFVLTLVLAILCAPIAYSQTTEVTYQGNLRDSGLPANADYDMEFRIFSTLSGGSPIITHFVFPITVVDGVFTAKFDVGQPAFPGQDRYLEIGIRRSGIGGLTTLGPRQRITSAPYAIQSLNASNATNALALGGVSASQFVVTTDTRLTDARSPLAGSASYIQNTNSQQASSNFNITGNGTAGTFSATTAFRFGGNHLLSAAGLDNVFAGSNSGLLNLGNNNAFFGAKAGQENKNGNFNAFFGAYAGQNNVDGHNNSFFGYFAGNATTTGNDNSFFGNRAGQINTSGAFNSFFGTFSGFFNATGSDNSFFGNETGYNNTSGNRNSFFGSKAGRQTSTGADNAFLGSFAGQNNSTGSNNAFVGSKAGQANATGMNNSFFGAGTGLNNTASNNTFAGADAGKFNTIGAHNTFVGRNAGLTTTEGELNTFIGTNAGSSNVLGRLNTIVGAEANVLGSNLSYATAIGAEAIVNTSNTVVIGRPADGVRIPGNLNVLGTFSAVNLSIANLTGVVGTANGGTGLSSSGTAGHFLRSDGTNWTSAPFTVTDVPSGSGFYVQNTTVQQGSTNFNISGNGTAGGTLWGNAVNSSTQYNIGGTRVLANTGTSNIFVGAGTATSGSNNTFVGVGAGVTNTTGSSNTLLGESANVGSGNLSFATAIGAGSSVSNNNSVVLGRSADTVRIPGNLVVSGTFTPSGSFSVSASNITGTLAAANGGTGLSVSGTAGNFLRSTGSGWQSQSLAANDIPGGSTNYIQNGSTPQAGAQFNVAGNGTIGGNLTVGGSISGSFSVPAANISGVLGSTSGGTGLNNVGLSGHFLKSNGTAWTTALLTASDIPSLAATYVQNTTTQQAGANFNIGGDGIIGDDLTVVGDLTVNGALNGSFAVPAANLTGTVGANHGGTGLTTSTGTNFLRGNGSGGWTSGTLTPADIPSLGGTYIQNQTSQQVSSNFNVSGSGTVGTTMTVGTTLTANTVNAVTQYNINGNRVFATNGTSNIFAGQGTGNTGSSNSFFGAGAGDSNVSGSQNTIVGANADVGSGTLTNATALGANAQVTQSNSVVLGGISGVNGGSDTKVGIGTTAPKTKLEVTGGDIHVGTPGQGIILKSPDGSACARISLSNAGALVTAAVTCP